MREIQQTVPDLHDKDVQRLTPAMSVPGYRAVSMVAFVLNIIVIAFFLMMRNAEYWKDDPDVQT